MINYYIVLEIPNFSNETVIKKAYRTMSKKYHPDVNSDPFASAYFQKINEAYNFLMDDNKRMLLHQFLTYQQPNQPKTNTHQPQYQQKTEPETVNLKPNIEVFYCDRKSFSLNDYISVHWQVSNCKSVKINVFGDVLLQGSQYYQVTKFVNELKIELEVLGFDDKIYTSTIVLPYFNEIPARKAYHQMVSNDPKTKEIHFRSERIFHSHSRISRLTFVNRIIVLTVLLLLSFIGFMHADFPHFYFIIVCALIAGMWVQFVKRYHDLIPINKTNYSSIFGVAKDLFFTDSVKTINKFGMYPEQEQLSFFRWVKSYFVKFNKERTIIEKASVLFFGLVMLCYSYQSIRNYNEFEINLTNNRVDVNRVQSKSSSYDVYQLQFDNSIWIDVTQNEYYAVVEKQFDSFLIGVNDDNEVKYVKAINAKKNHSQKLGTGLMSNANPLILILALMFLGQIYVLTQFKKADEKFYGSIYLGFTIFVYIVILVGYLM